MSSVGSRYSSSRPASISMTSSARGSARRCCSRGRDRRQVVVVQVVAGDRAERLHQIQMRLGVQFSSARLRCESGSSSASSNAGRRSSPSTSTLRSHVRWLSPTWSSCTRSGSTPNIAANSRWNPIATLQSPIARWPSIQQRLRHQAGRVGEVHEPRAGRAALGRLLGELQHHRHRPQRLGEPAGTGRLLADAPEPERDRLVPVAEPGSRPPGAARSRSRRRRSPRRGRR